jgi:type III restriction enzyme
MVPLLVVQVGDKPSQETLVRTLDTIYEAWPGLADDAVANVFGEHQDLTVGQQMVPYIEPQRVQDTKYVRVLLAKSAISTGWDCPRAEVLVSFRPANDRTHITQLLGRMMRTPARATDSRQRTAQLGGLPPAPVQPEDGCRGSGDADEGLDHQGRGRRWRGRGRWTGRRVLFDPIPLYRNPAIEQAVWDKFEDIPSVTIPKKNVKPIRRLTALATALSKDGLVADAVEQAHHHPSRSARRTGGAVRKEGGGWPPPTCSPWRARRSGVAWAVDCPTRHFALSADPRAIEDYYRGDAGDQPSAVLVLRGPSRRPGRGR